MNGTNPGSSLSSYADYSSSWFSGMSCSQTDQTSDCYIDTTEGMVWIKIPHFSGVGPKISGSTPTTPASTSADSGSGHSSGGVVYKGEEGED